MNSLYQAIFEMTVTVITPEELDGNGEINKPWIPFSWNDYDRHYLAEGDSWFAIGGILSPSFLYEFGYSVPLDKRTLIVNCAYPGDTLRKMVDWSTNARFHNQLFDKGFGRKWDGIFLSAGGNDVIEAALAPRDGILQLIKLRSTSTKRSVSLTRRKEKYRLPMTAPNF